MPKSAADLEKELALARARERDQKDATLRTRIHVEQNACRSAAARVGLVFDYPGNDAWGWSDRDISDLHWPSGGVAVEISTDKGHHAVTGCVDPQVHLYDRDGRLLARYSIPDEWIGGTWDDAESRTIAAFLTEAIDRLEVVLKTPRQGGAPGRGWPPPKG